MESRRGEKSGQRLYSARPEQGFSIEGPRPCALSLELPGAERSGEAYRRREEPDINTLCPQSTFQELPVMGKEYASLDRS